MQQMRNWSHDRSPSSLGHTGGAGDSGKQPISVVECLSQTGKVLGQPPAPQNFEAEFWTLFWLTFKLSDSPGKWVHSKPMPSWLPRVHTLSFSPVSLLLSVLCRVAGLTFSESLSDISGLGTSCPAHQNPSDGTLLYNSMAKCLMHIKD